ncbi:DUF4091 domain-containing protein [Salegentibacter sp. BLCTC]|uniref:DUF4091 domain-containing protein n=1 Tax=Salegentibacter sp. BLCTC TaxID=2697368 RepID=UPI00187B5741|nr:DUF4091 domain-containing protein [Salegentibacter sp. BLCTC]MBE7640008.1 DUF4091 domain-containing protein [Salegentibacter sp. BLCTC]
MKSLNPVFLLSFIFLSGSLFSQVPEGVTHSGQNTGQKKFPLGSYTELDNPTSTPLQEWKKNNKTIVGWGDTNKRYKKEEPVSKNTLSKKIELQAWRGEKVSAQWVVSAGKKDLDISVELSDLQHKSTKSRISKDNMESAFVRYVLTDELNKDRKGACGHRNPANFDSTLVADVIDHINPNLEVEKNTSRPGWLSIKVPENVSPGLYSGTIKIRSASKTIQKLPISINVSERVLPKPKDWNFHLDLWQNPYAVARYYQTNLWSKAHFDALKKEMTPYANAGGKSITASIIDRPWDGQTHDPFNSMVRWTKKMNGEWVFNFDVFDKWVEFMMNLGVTKQINAYTMIPWKLTFAYFDEASNKTQYLETQPGEELYEEVWVAMLSSFSKHLKQKGWFEKTYIAMDERPMETMQETIKVIHKADKNFKISFAGAKHPELYPYVDDYCLSMESSFAPEVLKQRKESGKISTFYTSCSHTAPNSFTFSGPAETEWYAWYASASNLDGFLRWAYNSWVLEPLLDSRFTTWAAGDTYFIYPEGRSSLRFEKLLAGIQSFEKLQILRDEFKKNNNIAALKKLEEIESQFTLEHLETASASEIIKQARKKLHSL